MTADFTSQLQDLIDRLATGDTSARNELIGRAYERLQRLARKMLRRFPHVGAFEDSSDVLHDSLPRLMRALEAVPPASTAQFFGLASRQMHWELLDLAKRYAGEAAPRGNPRQAGASDSSPGAPLGEPAAGTDSPSSLASWTEFHVAVESLPERERDVFDLLYYQELTHAEAAALMHVSESTVRRLWLSARRRLGAFLRGAEKDPSGRIS
jgi:RNA polymerase sigma-70 factor (ECF subfamily)